MHGNNYFYKLEVQKGSALTESVGHSLYAYKTNPGQAISGIAGAGDFVRSGSLSTNLHRHSPATNPHTGRSIAFA